MECIWVKLRSPEGRKSCNEGLRVTSNLLITFPKIDAVFATNAQSGIDADVATQQARHNELFIVGVDGAPDAVKAMNDKNSLFVATAAQNPQGLAEKAVAVARDILQGKKPNTLTILLPVQLVTGDDVSSYNSW